MLTLSVLLPADDDDGTVDVPVELRLDGDQLDDAGYGVADALELILADGEPVGPWGAEVAPTRGETAAGVWTVEAAVRLLRGRLVTVDGLELTVPAVPDGAVA